MTDILVTDFVKGLLIFVRVSGIMFTAPVFSNKSIPVGPKIFFSLMITYMLFFVVPDFEYNVEQGLLLLALYALKEILVGILMGFMLNFVFYAISYAGLMVGFDMGLAMARQFDPSTETQTNVMGQALTIMTIMIFMVINGHHYVVTGLSYSFNLIPIGFFSMNGTLFDILMKYMAGVFILAVKIASPITVSFFLLHVGAGILARTIPQMNIFFVVQPLKTMLGFGLLISITPVYVYVIRNLLMSYENKLFELIKAMS